MSEIGRRLQELRRSNAAGRMLDKRTKRRRSRKARKDAAIKEQSGNHSG